MQLGGGQAWHYVIKEPGYLNQEEVLCAWWHQQQRWQHWTGFVTGVHSITAGQCWINWLSCYDNCAEHCQKGNGGRGVREVYVNQNSIQSAKIHRWNLFHIFMYQRICSSVLCTDICHIEEPFFTNLVHTAQLCWPWRKSSEPLKRVGYIRFTKSCPFTYVHQAKLIYSKLNCCKGEKKKQNTIISAHTSKHNRHSI